MNLRDALDIVKPNWEHPDYPNIISVFPDTTKEAYENLSLHQKAVVDTLIGD